MARRGNRPAGVILLLSLLTAAAEVGGNFLSLVDAEEGGVFLEQKEKQEVFVPFIDLEEAKKIEQALSEAWNLYDARLYHRVRASLEGSLRGCLTPARDSYLGVWGGNHTIPTGSLPASYFCDALVLPLPPLTCEEADMRIKAAEQHAQSVYYNQYWASVRETLAQIAPKGVSWSRWNQEGGGSYLIPVKSREVHGLEHLEAAMKPHGGMAYLTQARAENPKSRFQRTGKPEPPGIPEAEKAKSQATDRGGIHPSPGYWAGQGGGPKPQGKLFTAPPETLELYGLATFLRVYSKTMTESSPRSYSYSCVPAGGLFPVHKTYRATHTQTRAETGWFTLAEGYPLPYTVGSPSVGP